MSPETQKSNKNRFVLWVKALFLLLSLSPITLFTAEQQGITLIVTGGYRGRVEGCNCPGGLTGGLSQRIVMSNERFPNQMLSGLDCGAILDLDPEMGRFTSRCTIFGLAKLGLKVIGVTPRDLFYGVEFLKSIADSAGVQLVSANLFDAETDELIFKPWAVLLVPSFPRSSVGTKPYKLAVTSLIDGQPGRRFNVPVGWTRCPPDSVIDELVKTVPEDTDYIILLTDMGEGTLREMLRDVSIFDIALTSSRQFYTASSFILEKTLIAHPYPDGRSLDYIRLYCETLPEFFSQPIPENKKGDPAIEKWLRGCLGRDE